jgi:hypothetical protein
MTAAWQQHDSSYNLQAATMDENHQASCFKPASHATYAAAWSSPSKPLPRPSSIPAKPPAGTEASCDLTAQLSCADSCTAASISSCLPSVTLPEEQQQQQPDATPELNAFVAADSERRSSPELRNARAQFCISAYTTAFLLY